MGKAGWAGVIVFLGGMAWAVSAGAETSTLSGTYTFNEETSDELEEAFEPALEEMGRIRRGFARRALADADEPHERMEIDKSKNRIVIRPGDDPVQTIPLDGETVENRNEEGELVDQKVQAVEQRAVTIHTAADEGDITTEYRLGADGRQLEIVMEMDFDQLPKTVTYRLVYNRR